MLQKKNAAVNENNSKQSIFQGVKARRGPKTGPPINEIIKRRDIALKAFLQLYFNHCMDVPPEAGLTTLARYIYEILKLKTTNGKRLSVNTIRVELSDIAKEYGYKNPRVKNNI